MIVEPRTNRNQTVRAHREEKPPLWDILRPGETPPQPDQEMLETIQGEQYDGDGGVYFDCEAVGPPSSKGRTVVVHVPREQILALLKLCKYAASKQRAQVMS